MAAATTRIRTKTRTRSSNRAVRTNRTAISRKTTNRRTTRQGDDKEQQGDPQQNPAQPDKEQEGDPQGEPQPVPAGISPQEQEQMLDAIQAQEDRTQDKLKEKQGVVVRGSKNW